MWKLCVLKEALLYFIGDITLDVKGEGQTEFRRLVVAALKVEQLICLDFHWKYDCVYC